MNIKTFNSPESDSSGGHAKLSLSPAQEYYHATLAPLSRDLEILRQIEGALYGHRAVQGKINEYVIRKGTIKSISPLGIIEDERISFVRAAIDETKINENIIVRVLGSIEDRRKGSEGSKKSLTTLLEESLEEMGIEPMHFYIAFMQLKFMPKKQELENAKAKYSPLAKAEADKSVEKIVVISLLGAMSLLALNKGPEIVMFCQHIAQKIVALLSSQ